VESVDISTLQDQLNEIKVSIDSKIEESTQLTAQIVRNVVSKMSELESKFDSASAGSAAAAIAPSSSAPEQTITSAYEEKLKQLQAKVDSALSQIASEATRHTDTQIVSVLETLQDSVDKSLSQATSLVKHIEASLLEKIDNSITSSTPCLALSLINLSYACRFSQGPVNANCPLHQK